MAIRLATVDDIPLMSQLLQEFADSIGPGTVIDPARLERRIQRWPLIQAVDDVAGAYCELKVREEEQEAEFSAAFPRGASRGVIGPVFAACGREAIRLLRARGHRLNDLRGWRVWGEFLHGQNAARVPDGGREICEAWRDYFALDGKTVTVRPADPTKPEGKWIAEMPVGELAEHGA